MKRTVFTLSILCMILCACSKKEVKPEQGKLSVSTYKLNSAGESYLAHCSFYLFEANETAAIESADNLEKLGKSKSVQGFYVYDGFHHQMDVDPGKYIVAVQINYGEPFNWWGRYSYKAIEIKAGQTTAIVNVFPLGGEGVKFYDWADMK